jgi:hypothetical protein
MVFEDMVSSYAGFNCCKHKVDIHQTPFNRTLKNSVNPHIDVVSIVEDIVHQCMKDAFLHFLFA